MGAEAEGSTGGQPRTHALRECGIAAITDHGEDERVGDVERPTDERSTSLSTFGADSSALAVARAYLSVWRPTS
jgi:hypothetical protein